MRPLLRFRLFAGLYLLLFGLLLVPLAPRAFAAAAWNPNFQPYVVGDLVTYNTLTYQCRQAHTSQPGWDPPSVPALWLQVTGPTATTGPNTTPTRTPTRSATPLRSATPSPIRSATPSPIRSATPVRTSTPTPPRTSTPTVGQPTPTPNLGTLPKRLLIGYWHNFDNGSGFIRLRDVSTKWDIINISFAEPTTPGGANMAFVPYGTTADVFKSDVAYLKSLGKRVVISIGGANGAVDIADAARQQQFASSMIGLVETYGFDGIDIDLEASSLSLNPGDTDFRNPTTPKITNLIAATRTILNRFGANFLLTMAPETAYVQGGYSTYGSVWGAYLPVIYAFKDRLNVLQVQHYNSGGLEALDGRVYSQGTADFQVAMAEMLLAGFPVARNTSNVFPALRPDQIAIGLPASPQAASGGYTDPATVQKALDYLIKGQGYGGTYVLRKTTGYPSLRGLMTWSINWDRYYSFQFSNSHRTYLNALP